MSIFVERFLLGLLVTICAATIIANPFKFDLTQKVSLVCAITFVALFAARTIERLKEVVPPLPEQHLPAIALAPSAPVDSPTHPQVQRPEAPVHLAHLRPRVVTPNITAQIAPEPKPTAGDSSVWKDIDRLSSTPEAANRREDSRILEEAYSRLVNTHLKISASLKDFQPSRGAGGVPNLASRTIEGQFATPRIGYDSPVIFTKYEIRISNGHLLFADKDAGAPFFQTPVGSPDYGDNFLAAVRRSMEPQIRAELNRK